MSERPPIYCTGGCDACRDYARELGVPLIVPAPQAISTIQSSPDIDATVERVTRAVSRPDWTMDDIRAAIEGAGR